MSFLRLQYTRSDGEVDTYHLKSGRRYNVGRGSDCEVRILDMRLSRKHCAFEDSDGIWSLIDLGSTNGCKINAERINGTIAVTAPTSVTLGSVKIMVASISEHIDDQHPAIEKDFEKEAEGGTERGTERETEKELEREHVSEKHKSSSDFKTEILNEDHQDSQDNQSENKTATDTSTNTSADASASAQTSQSSVDEYAPSASSARLEPIQVEEVSKIETKTVFISALGRKVGPITRTQARELKKCELKGKLTEEALEKIIGESD